MKYKHCVQKGFTLIELLITVAIIGILAAIALPTFMKKDNEGKKQELKNNDVNYNDYKRKCINNQMYMVSKSGDLRVLLTDDKDPVFCEGKTENTKELEVNANPYNKTN